ncbi:MAG: hypothetical protein V3V50_04040 [Gammaproteobacteria bacterium]
MTAANYKQALGLAFFTVRGFGIYADPMGSLIDASIDGQPINSNGDGLACVQGGNISVFASVHYPPVTGDNIEKLYKNNCSDFLNAEWLNTTDGSFKLVINSMTATADYSGRVPFNSALTYTAQGSDAIVTINNNTQLNKVTNLGTANLDVESDGSIYTIRFTDESFTITEEFVAGASKQVSGLNATSKYDLATSNGVFDLEILRLPLSTSAQFTMALDIPNSLVTNLSVNTPDAWNFQSTLANGKLEITDLQTGAIAILENLTDDGFNSNNKVRISLDMDNDGIVDVTEDIPDIDDLQSVVTDLLKLN